MNNAPLSVDGRECQDCRWFTDLGSLNTPPICQKKLMGVTHKMHVTYKTTEGTCFEEKEMNNPEIVTSDMTQEFIRALIRREAAQARMAEARKEIEECVWKGADMQYYIKLWEAFYTAQGEFDKAHKDVTDIAKKITNCDLSDN